MADEPLESSSTGESRQLSGLWVSGEFFNVLGIKPALGHFFTAKDDKRGCGFVPGAVISYGFWQHTFGGDLAVIGRTLELGKNRVQVIGVTPPSFFGLEVGRTFDVVLPIYSEPPLLPKDDRTNSGTTWWLTVMRDFGPSYQCSKPRQCCEPNQPIYSEPTLPVGYPADSVKPYLAMRLLAVPAGRGLSKLRDKYSKPLALLLTIAGLVLLIACTSLASLMLARGKGKAARNRCAVGSGRLPISTCSLVVDRGSTALGCRIGSVSLLAAVLARILVLFISTTENLIVVDLQSGVHVFGFAAVLAILTCLVCASAPILQATRTDVTEALSSPSRSLHSGRERIGVGRTLLAGQIVISFALLVATLLFVQSLRNLTTLDPGFKERRVMVADIKFPQLGNEPARSVSFRREIVDRVRADPEIESAVEATIMPLTGGNWNNRVWMDGPDFLHAKVSLANDGWRWLLPNSENTIAGRPRI